MSAVAKRLSKTRPDLASVTRRGPSGACQGKYPGCDLEDWAEVERLRASPSNWREAQRLVDEAFGVTDPIPNDKFRYHWRRKCWCWPVGQRLL